MWWVYIGKTVENLLVEYQMMTNGTGATSNENERF